MGACDKILYSDRGQFGQNCFVGRRTAGHLDSTKERLAAEHPGTRLVIIQSAFNTDVPKSEGSHDFDAALDVFIGGMDFTNAQRFLRKCGWAAWHRFPPAFGHHIHMVSLGCPCQVGGLVPGQIADYRAKPPRNGLAGHAIDNTFHPENIEATVFDFEEWRKQIGDEMRQEDWERLNQIERRNTDRLIRVVGRLLGKTENQVMAEFESEEKRDKAEGKRDEAQAKAVADVMSTIDNLPENADLEQKEEVIAHLRRRLQQLRDELAKAQEADQ